MHYSLAHFSISLDFSLQCPLSFWRHWASQWTFLFPRNFPVLLCRLFWDSSLYLTAKFSLSLHFSCHVVCCCLLWVSVEKVVAATSSILPISGCFLSNFFLHPLFIDTVYTCTLLPPEIYLYLSLNVYICISLALLSWSFHPRAVDFIRIWMLFLNLSEPERRKKGHQWTTKCTGLFFFIGL